MKREIAKVVETVSNEKGLIAEVIFEAIEETANESETKPTDTTKP